MGSRIAYSMSRYRYVLYAERIKQNPSITLISPSFSFCSKKVRVGSNTSGRLLYKIGYASKLRKGKT